MTLRPSYISLVPPLQSKLSRAQARTASERGASSIGVMAMGIIMTV